MLFQPSTGWNQADLDYSDDEREEQGADIIASGTLHTIHEAPQDGDFFHSRAINCRLRIFNSWSAIRYGYC